MHSEHASGARSEDNLRKPAAKGKNGKAGELRNFVSDELRSVLDEEQVTYSWRRKPAASSVAAPSRPAETSPRSVNAGHNTEGDDDESGRGTTTAVAPKAGCSKGLASDSTRAAPKAGSVGARLPSEESHSRAKPSSAEVKSGGKASKQLFKFDGGAKVGGKPPRPGVASHVLAVARGPTSNFAGDAVPGATPARTRVAAHSGVGTVDIEAALKERDARVVAHAATLPDFAATLVAYDGTTPRLKPSALADACGWALARWVRGEISGAAALLHVENWTQGEVCWPEETCGALLQRLGYVAGMLADASLQRASITELLGSVFAETPAAEVTLASQAVIAYMNIEGNEVLVSEVEHALSVAESNALSEGAAARLRAAVRRELLRQCWAAEPSAAVCWGGADDDVWLLGQLATSPQEAVVAARTVSRQQLQREIRRLDEYMIRLLKLKRALVAILDTWEKVDHYAVLGVSPTVSDKELKVAYRKACLRLHPDKGGDKAQFQQLQDSYARILEERAARQGQSATSPASGQPPDANPQHPQQGGATGTASTDARGGKQLALEGVADSDDAASQGATPAAAAEVAKAEEALMQLLERMRQQIAEAERAEATVKQLNQTQPEGVEALRNAQEAGYQLLDLGFQIGDLGPQLSDAIMEVAESSLAMSARFAAVPTAILLTDVALSCTFEASRMKHAARQLMDVRHDTVATLQTLQTNLDMARLIGTVDAETLRLSLGLVSKATQRIMAALHQVSAVVVDARQRAHQCGKHARAVATFAARRAATDAEFAADDILNSGLALPPAPGCSSDGGPTGAASPTREPHTGGPCPGGAPEPTGPSSPQAHANPESAGSGLLESRLQSDRLLRQLNEDLLALQRRAKKHLATRGGVSALQDLPAQALFGAMQLAAEALANATEAVEKEVLASGTDAAAALKASMEKHLRFVETCGCDLAMPVDLRAQLLRLAAFVDAQAVLAALEGQAKVRLVAACSEAARDDEEIRDQLVAALDQQFERLFAAVVAAKLV